ncbi:hypothetical protein CRUP_012390, partial [Coryphaenoides rupestris]
MSMPPAAVVVTSRAAREEDCPLGQFPCGNMSLCLPQLLQCNGHKDCPNGADERRCAELAKFSSFRPSRNPSVRDNVGWADLFGRVPSSGDPADGGGGYLDECSLSSRPSAPPPPH